MTTVEMYIKDSAGQNTFQLGEANSINLLFVNYFIN